jgi:hypothetical protein
MTTKRLASRSIVILILVLAPSAFAQDFDLSWHTVDGGGAMLTSGGDFELSGTASQCDAGPSTAAMTGGDFALTGGFWLSGVPEVGCDDDPNYLEYHTCPDPLGTPPYNIDCRVWTCDGADACVEIPSEGLSQDGTYNLYGDVNDDGAVTPSDIACLQKYAEYAPDPLPPEFHGCDKGGAGGPVVEFEYMDFAPCRHAKNPNGRGDGSVTPAEIQFIQKIGESSGPGLPDDPALGDCYYCGGND